MTLTIIFFVVFLLFWINLIFWVSLIYAWLLGSLWESGLSSCRCCKKRRHISMQSALYAQRIRSNWVLLLKSKDQFQWFQNFKSKNQFQMTRLSKHPSAVSWPDGRWCSKAQPVEYLPQISKPGMLTCLHNCTRPMQRRRKARQEMMVRRFLSNTTNLKLLS